jgi:hypothetical protein
VCLLKMLLLLSSDCKCALAVMTWTFSFQIWLSAHRMLVLKGGIPLDGHK